MNTDNRADRPKSFCLHIYETYSPASILLRTKPSCSVLALEWLYFNSVGRHFGTLDNTFDIIRHSVEIGLLALVMTPIILTGGIDLSVGSLLGLVRHSLWQALARRAFIALGCRQSAHSASARWLVVSMQCSSPNCACRRLS